MRNSGSVWRNAFATRRNEAQQGLDELDRLTEQWVADHLQRGKTSKKTTKNSSLLRRKSPWPKPITIMVKRKSAACQEGAILLERNDPTANTPGQSTGACELHRVRSTTMQAEPRYIRPRTSRCSHPRFAQC